LSVNNTPVLAAIANRTVHAGTTVVLNIAATDADLGQTLNFTLGPGAPAGAQIDAATGVFRWTTANADVNTTNTMTVQVADNGAPGLGDARSFTISVVAPPTVLSAALVTNSIVLSWSAISGQTYRVQFKSELSEADWSDLLDVTATASTASLTDPFITDTGMIPQRFYRILVLD
jgi:hypothetical protein